MRFLVEYQNVLESSGRLHGGAHLPQRVHLDKRVVPKPYMGLGAQPILVNAAKVKPRVSLGPSLRKLGGKVSPLATVHGGLGPS
jgi:hypothetical protein